MTEVDIYRQALANGAFLALVFEAIGMAIVYIILLVFGKDGEE